MGHYDECREGYCGVCGQAEGYCSHTSVKGKENNKTPPKNDVIKETIYSIIIKWEGTGNIDECKEEIEIFFQTQLCTLLH